MASVLDSWTVAPEEPAAGPAAAATEETPLRHHSLAQRLLLQKVLLCIHTHRGMHARTIPDWVLSPQRAQQVVLAACHMSDLPCCSHASMSRTEALAVAVVGRRARGVTSGCACACLRLHCIGHQSWILPPT